MGYKKGVIVLSLLRKVLNKAQNVFPVLGWLLIAYPARKFAISILYHARFYKLFGWSFSGLHLGSGGNKIENFLNIDGNPAASCDVVAGVDKINLRDGSVATIYTSHVFEHIPRARIKAVLDDWFRVLKHGGRLYICVPDLEVLSRIYLGGLGDYSVDVNVRARVDLACGVAFGGQVNRFDYHYYGYSAQTLAWLLKEAGFASVDRFNRASMADAFPFNDASYALIDGTPISLNLVAEK